MVTLAHVLSGMALVAHAFAGPLVFARDGSRVDAHKKLTGKFLHISDFHPDLNYKPHSDPETSCHRGSGSAGHWGAEATDCDSPPSLVDATFEWISKNIRNDIDFVVWTGDSARHDGDEDLPRRPDEITKTNRWVADKFAETFSTKNGQLDIPIIPSIGNNDFLPHNIFYAGPNKWLTEYLDVWRHFIPNEQRHSFQRGGWFSVEAVPNKLAVISLNTMYFFGRNAGVDGCADPNEPGYAHLEWLRVVLQDLRERDMKAILTGHVPPARTENKQLWDETCWQKYTLWMRQYRDVVTASLYGHMNIDHFILADSRDIGEDLGGRMRAKDDWWAEEEEEDIASTPPATDGQLSIQGKGSYLADLRSGWSKISPPSPPQTEDFNGRRGNRWGERYSLAIVNPSIVPNYLPTMRIYEYDITGMEDAPVWQDDPNKFNEEDEDIELFDEEDEDEDEGTALSLDDESAALDEEYPLHHELKRDLSIDRKKGKKHKNKNKKKPARPHDPNLVIPAPPSKTAAPGPAYSPQPLSLTGYTQMFANLTKLNGEEGEHLPLEFEVEYSTFTDKWYRIPDLTVRNYAKLAYRIARRASALEVGEDEDGEVYDDFEVVVDTAGKTSRSNKLWLRFLERAFIGTVPREDLKKWDD